MNTKTTEHRPRPESPVRRLRGLGDVVHVMAWPVAFVIDAASKAVGKPTNIRNCQGCKKRRDDLNAKFPSEHH